MTSIKAPRNKVCFRKAVFTQYSVAQNVLSAKHKNFEGGEGKNTQIILGKDLFIKGFDKQLLGVKKNQEKEIVAILPENYPKKEFSNKKNCEPATPRSARA